MRVEMNNQSGLELSRRYQTRATNADTPLLERPIQQIDEQVVRQSVLNGSELPP